MNAEQQQSARQHLAVDIGNSGLRVARLQLSEEVVEQPLRINWLHLSSGERLVSSSPTHGLNRDRYLPDSSQWFECLNNWLNRISSELRAYTWHVSSVRTDAFQQLAGFVESRPNDRLHCIRYEEVPLAVGVDAPSRLGIDRLLAAFAASRLVAPRPLLVIQAGSAVTVDIVEQAVAEDRFAGGAILPGIPMMLRLLGRGADMLPEMDADDLVTMPDFPGRNTEAAMLCGAASCLVGGVQHLVSRFREVYGRETPVVISGGDGVRLLPSIPSPVRIEPDLVMRGILQVARTG